MSEIAFWDEYSKFVDGVFTGPGVGPLYSDNPWDVVMFTVGGAFVLLPGICKAHGFPTIGIDKKASKGRDGLAFNVNGYIPGPVEIESTIWTLEQWSKWQEIIPRIWRRPNAGSVKGSSLAINISYPSLQFAGINSVVIIGISPPQKGSFAQSMVIKLKALEFVPPGAVNNRPVTAAPGGPPATKHYRTKDAPPPPSAGGNGLSGPLQSKLGGAS